MSVIDSIHGGYVHKRRVRVLCETLAPLLPPNATVLDIGCGDGLLDALIIEKRPDVKIEGIDVLVRGGTHIPVTEFDGTHIPFPDKSFDAALFVDVLHHTEDPNILLREAERIAKTAVVIKDHICNSELDHRVLTFMDNVGNARYGVALPHNYLSKQEWDTAIAGAKLRVDVWKDSIPLYPPPASWVFGRQLHVITRLAPIVAPSPAEGVSAKTNGTV
jgi:SAM-dependent methyltransferase